MMPSRKQVNAVCTPIATRISESVNTRMMTGVVIGEANQDDAKRDQEPALQRYSRHQGGDLSRWRQEPVRCAEMPGDDADCDDLDADQDGDRRYQEGIGADNQPLRQGNLAGEQCDCSDQTQKDQRQARIQEQPARAEHQEEAQMAPAIMPGPQVRGPRSPIDVERGRHFRDDEPVERGTRNHLAGEFHSRCIEAERENPVAPEAA
jgi:hypothetical protein